jgi:hypothetical protein
VQQVAASRKDGRTAGREEAAVPVPMSRQVDALLHAVVPIVGLVYSRAHGKTCLYDESRHLHRGVALAFLSRPARHGFSARSVRTFHRASQAGCPAVRTIFQEKWHESSHPCGIGGAHGGSGECGGASNGSGTGNVRAPGARRRHRRRNRNPQAAQVAGIRPRPPAGRGGAVRRLARVADAP